MAANDQINEITWADWLDLPDGYKLIREDGTCMMLKWIDGHGTCLVPVTVERTYEIADTEYHWRSK